MITSSYPALQVFLPMIVAPLCVLLSRHGKFALTLTLVACWSVFAMCASTLSDVIHTGNPIEYFMGGWEPPYGIEYRIDLLSATMLTLVSLMAAIVATYGFRSVAHEVDSPRRPMFYAAFLLCFSGLQGIISTNDAFNMYVFLEISSLSSYALIAMGRDRRALSAAFDYLVLGTIGATFILIGVGLLYIMTGTLNITDLGSRIEPVLAMRPIMAAFAFLAVGLCMKVALFPLHLWLPNAYTYAPSIVSSFLAAVGTKVGIYAILRFFYTLYGYEYSFSGMHLSLILAALSIPAILLGSLAAVFQKNVKRMLAFSSVAQIGYITLGISLSSLYGLVAALTHLLAHALTKGALFMALGAIALRLHGRCNLSDLQGLGRHMPLTSLAIVLAALSLLGIPLTAGFTSKWYLLSASIHQGWWLATITMVIGSLLAMVYLWKVVEALYFLPAPERNDLVVEAPASMLIPLWLLVFLILYLGVDTRLTVGIATQITALFLGGQP